MPLQIASYPSPTGGWNAFNALDQMPPGDAVTLDNWFPEQSYVRLRRGYTLFCDTGEGAHTVGTLMPYAGGASSKFLAAVNGKIFEISTGTASSLTTGKGSDIWSFTNYSSAGGKYILAANDSGADKPIVYNGSTIANVAVTGVTDTNLSQVAIYAQRTFYVERDTLSVWYTTAGAYQGALTEFDFGPLCALGGRIATIGTWTRDNGFGGADDLFVVVTTRGEVLLYTGTNPGDPTAWSLTGRFVVGQPVKGPHCVVSTGPDLMLLCADGFQPLSQYLSLGETRAQTTNLAQKIGNASSDAVKLYRDNVGWGALLYPPGTQIIINVPTDVSTFQQYVVNTATGAWCRYTNLPAACWALFANQPYFGSTDGKIYLWDTGYSDNGSNITAEMCTAFQYPGGRGRQNLFTMARPVLQVSGPLRYALDMAVDFNLSATLPTISVNSAPGGLWGTGVWGQSIWGNGSLILSRRWSGVSGVGYAAAVRLKVSTQSIEVRVNSFDVGFQVGGPL